MPTFKRLSLYLVVFILLLMVVALTELWRPLDYFLYRSFDASSEIKLRKDIVIIDLPWIAEPSNSFDRPNFRKRLVDLLNVIDSYGQKERPKAVVLDIVFKSDGRELKELMRAIERLSTNKVKVYAVFDTLETGKTFKDKLSNHEKELYKILSKPYLHTVFHQWLGVLSYESEVEILNGNGTSILVVTALPLQVAKDQNVTTATPSGRIELPLGEKEKINSQTYAFKHDEQSTSGGKFWHLGKLIPNPTDEKIVIVGSLKKDKLGFVKQPGPNLVAWAINYELHSRGNARMPLKHPGLVLGQILFFALLTTLVYALLFGYIKRLQTKPLVLACLSVGIGSSALAAFAAALLAVGIVTQVGLTLLAMVIAGVLSWRFALKFLVTCVAEGSGKYDVFISYSRQQSDWVVPNIYEPLKAMCKADDSKLSVFFDRAEIGVGEAFTAKYMWAIVDSRIFIPVFSEGYYEKNHCRNEMDVAYKRSVEEKITILPIALSCEAVPKIYSHMNYIDAQANPDFIEKIREIVAPKNPTQGDQAVQTK